MRMVRDFQDANLSPTKMIEDEKAAAVIPGFVKLLKTHKENYYMRMVKSEELKDGGNKGK